MKNIMKILLMFAIILSTISAGAQTQMSVRRIINPGPNLHSLQSAGTTHCAGTAGPNIYLASSNTNTACQLYQLISPGVSIPIGTPLTGSGGVVNFGSQNDGTYFCIVTNTLTGCSDTMLNYVTISSMPIPTVDITSSGPTTGCGTVTVTLSTPYETGCTYQWQKNSVNIPFATGTSYTATVTNTTEVYTCIATNSLGCNNSDFEVITANPLPTAFTVSTSTPTFCEGGIGGSVNQSSSLSGINYQLMLNGSTLVGTPVAGTNAAIQWNGLLTGGVYTVVATNPLTGCTATMTGSAVLTMDPVPDDAGPITGPATVCQNSTATYYIGTIPNATSYSWSVPLGANILTGQGTTMITVDFTGSASGSISVLGSNACGPGTASMFSVTVNAAPTLTINSSAADICAGSSTNLTATGSGVSFAWSGMTATTATVTVNPLTTTTYYVTATGSNLCTATDDIVITVHTAPSVTLSLAEDNFCMDINSAVLSGGLPAGGTYTGSCVFGGNTIYPPVSGPGTYVITYEVTDTWGCSNSATDLLTINPLPVVMFVNVVGAIYTDTPPFDLTAYVSPIGGTFSGPGMVGSMFNPAAAGQGTHMIEYTYTHPITGCSASQIQYITVGSVGIDEVTAAVDLITMFPNPAADQLHLVGIDTKEIVALSIYDLIGKVVYSAEVNSETMDIDVNVFQPGVYLIKFSDADGVSVTKRFVKE